MHLVYVTVRLRHGCALQIECVCVCRNPSSSSFAESRLCMLAPNLEEWFPRVHSRVFYRFFRAHHQVLCVPSCQESAAEYIRAAFYTTPRVQHPQSDGALCKRFSSCTSRNVLCVKGVEVVGCFSAVTASSLHNRPPPACIFVPPEGGGGEKCCFVGLLGAIIEHSLLHLKLVRCYVMWIVWVESVVHVYLKT